MAMYIDNTEYLSDRHDMVSDYLESEKSTVRENDRINVFRRQWQELIDYRLIDWGMSFCDADDDSFDAPSRETIARAIQLARKFRSEGLPPPDSVVPDANGGIVFERRELDVTEVLHIWGDGDAEYQQFQGARLVERTSL